MKTKKPGRRFTLLIGILLLAEGVWGLFSNNIFGAISINTRLSIIHIVVGIAGLYYGSTGNTRKYNILLGASLLLLAILHFIPLTAGIIKGLFDLNDLLAYLYIFIGISALYIGLTTRKLRKQRSLLVVF